LDCSRFVCYYPVASQQLVLLRLSFDSAIARDAIGFVFSILFFGFDTFGGKYVFNQFIVKTDEKSHQVFT
jgi:hypothetical protein